jgi:PAS domain S-box-containing protein
MGRDDSEGDARLLEVATNGAAQADRVADATGHPWPREVSRIWRLGVPVIGVALVVGLKLTFDEYIGRDTPSLLLLPVMLAAWYGGVGSGFVATILAMAAAEYFFLPPYRSFAVDGAKGVVQLTALMIEGGLIAFSVAKLQQAKRRTEAAALLHRNERSKVEVILQNIEHGVTVQDPTGRLTYANDFAAALAGYPSAESFLRAPMAEVMAQFELFDENGMPFPQSHLPGRMALAGRRSGEIVLKFRTLKTGEERWSAVTAAPVLDQNGKVQFAVNLFRDVTENRREQDRRKLVAEASALIADSLDYDTTLKSVAHLAVPTIADWCAVDMVQENGSLDRVAVAHVDPAKVEFARELERRYPTAADDPTGVPKVIGTGQPLLIPDISDEMLVAAARDAEHLKILRELSLRSCIVVPMVARNRTLGAMTLVSSESSRRFNSADLRLAEDIADRAAVALDNALLYRDSERARAKAEASERRFKAVFENTMDAVVTADDDLRYLDVNPAACYLFGLPRDQLVGRKINEFGTTVQFPSAQSSWQHFRREGYQHGEFMLTRPDGQVRTLEYNAVASFLPGQHLSVLRDVTARKQQEEERAQSLAREQAAHRLAEEETKLRELLLSIVGHDLRNPLGAIKVTTHLLLKSENLGPAEQSKVRRISNISERMSRLISQLLDFSLIRMGGGLTMDVRETNLNRICEEVIEELRIINPKHEIQLETTDPIVGQWDPDRIAEMFSNLVGNAVQYSHPSAAIKVSLRPSGLQSVIVEVHNWGEPIRPDVLPHIFEPFRRGTQDKSNSVGLGLYIVRQIVLAHRGRIDVTSSSSEGTRFSVCLPL